jgi:hypothetical protein
MSIDWCNVQTSSCKPFDCKEKDQCETTSSYDKTLNHVISTHQQIQVGVATINLIKTDRTLNVEWGKTRYAPRKTNAAYENNELVLVRCGDVAPDEMYCTFVDNCKIEKSEIAFLDLRYNVCLYKNRVQELRINSLQRDNEQALFRTQTGPFHRVRVMTNDFTQTDHMQWILLKDGVKTVLYEESVTPAFVGGAYQEGEGASIWFPDYKRPAGIHLILIFPFPASYGIAQSDLECGTPFYDYTHLPMEEPDLARLDGGKDMFYPEWCRNMQEDPIWREAADRRWNAKWWHVPEEKNRKWMQPEVQLKMFPVGSYIEHPEVGKVYQFLLQNTSGEPKIFSSPDFTSIVDQTLKATKDSNGANAGLSVHNNTVYYPLGVV